MQARILALVAILLAGFALMSTHQASAKPSVAAAIITCQSPYIIDGDTFDCDGTRIRLSSIDTPEMPDHCPTGKKCAAGDPFAAKAHLQSLIQGDVTCTRVTTDKYGRTVANCISNGQDLSCAMFKSGHAIQRYGTLSCS